MGWRTSNPHSSDDPRIGRHVDVECYDDRGQKDKSAGKMKISYDESKPVVQDVRPPKK